MRFEVENMRAEFFGNEYSVLRLDLVNSKVELEDEGWIDLDQVEFISSFEEDLDDSYLVKRENELLEEARRLKKMENNLILMKRDVEAKLALTTTLKSKLESEIGEEVLKFQKEVTKTMLHLNEVVQEVIYARETRKRNSKLKEPTEEYLKYETESFMREMMESIKNVKDTLKDV